jgi:hypothetical protein
MGWRKDYQSAEYRDKRIKDFWKRIDTSGDPWDCWPWLGGTNPSTGYGYYDFVGKRISTHRLAYELWHGPTDSFVLHKCDNRLCCNPLHLFAGTQKENLQDMVKKGRSLTGERHHMRKLSWTDVNHIRIWHSLAAEQPTYVEIAAQYGVSPAQIGRIIRGTHWKPFAHQ